MSNPIQQHQTLYCVTDQHVVFPVIVKTIADVDKCMLAIVTALPDDYVPTQHVLERHKDSFANFFVINGEPNKSSIFKNPRHAVALALRNAEQEAQLLTLKLERINQQISLLK